MTTPTLWIQLEASRLDIHQTELALASVVQRYWRVKRGASVHKAIAERAPSTDAFMARALYNSHFEIAQEITREFEPILQRLWEIEERQRRLMRAIDEEWQKEEPSADRGQDSVVAESRAEYSRNIKEEANKRTLLKDRIAEMVDEEARGREEQAREAKERREQEAEEKRQYQHHREEEQRKYEQENYEHHERLVRHQQQLEREYTEYCEREHQRQESERRREEERRKQEWQEQRRRYQREAEEKAAQRQQIHKKIQVWHAEANAAFADYSTIKTFPAPPVVGQCTNAVVCGAERNRALASCDCQVRHAFLSLADQVDFKVERLKWHPDRFSAVHENRRAEFVAMANQMFKVVSQLYEERR